MIHTLQPTRDLESNWSVDIVTSLEAYLLEICSGKVSGRDGAHQNPVNFSKAALLLQDSAQVYSRKVEYLYSLVLRALESISQKSEKQNTVNGSAGTEASGSNDAPDDPFWGLDDIPEQPKNLLDNTTPKDALLNRVVKAPANLVVLEGDSFDAIGDAGELECYLLATCDVYRDFILLDTCDATAIDNFFTNENKTGKGLNSSCKGRKSVQHFTRQSGGVGKPSSARKNQEPDLNLSPRIDNDFRTNDHMPENHEGLYGVEDVFSEPKDFSDSDEDDDLNPWKPLNPHEPGNFKDKPYRRVKAKRSQGTGSKKHMHVITQFPLARPHGNISLHLNDIWEKCFATKKMDESQSPLPYEKLRQSLFHWENIDGDVFHSTENNTDYDFDNTNYYSGSPDFHTPETAELNEDENVNTDKVMQHGSDGVPFDHEGHEDPNTHRTLEDLCRSHLDSLLANLAETERQTEMAARVSTWKQRIEQNLNEQELHTPFDIHEYGDKVLSKLSLKESSANGVSFSDIVSGEEKHNVARTFSALLQLVNNGDVDLQRGGAEGESSVYTGANPFYVRLLQGGVKMRDKVKLHISPKKKTKSPVLKGNPRGEKNKRGGKEKRPDTSSPPPRGSNNSNRRFTLQVGRRTSRCTPVGKKRRKSQLLEQPVDLHTGMSCE
ncbi:unnamed protein product [Cuscuta europaea]|uniref:Condensin-2 complex subunit H2 n=1 Tax=Cuscuta europaea TaxID=41803 RepID=A0A9P0ZM93_CUSEU|nr:unnamed protein product [Cuscuta europaea]